jgi:predicted RNA-binding protein YlxR (DUF448 family)
VRSASSRIERVASGDAEEEILVRLVVSPEGEITVDAGDGRYGRGAHVHPTPSCLEKGARGLMKSARRAVSVEGEGPSARVLAKLVEQAFQRRVEGLLVAARRARKIAVGSDATVTSLRSGRGKLVVLAGDAAAAAKIGEVRFEINEGRAVAFGDKLSLGALVRPAITGKTDDGSPADPPRVAVLAVEDVRLAAALREAVHVLDTVRGVAASVAQTGRGKAGGGKAGGGKGGRGAKPGPPASDVGEPGGVNPGDAAALRNFDDGAERRRASGTAATAEQTTVEPQRSAGHASDERWAASRLTSPETDSPGSNDEPEGVPGAGPGTGGVERGA